MKGKRCQFGIHPLELRIALFLDEFTELAYDDGDVFRFQILSQCCDHFGEAQTISDGSFFVAGIGFTLMPEDSSQTSARTGGGQCRFGSFNSIDVMRSARDPFMQCRAAESSGDQPDTRCCFHLHQCGGEASPQADTGAVWTVEVDWVDGRHPGLFLTEGEDARNWGSVGIANRASSSHI